MTKVIKNSVVFDNEVKNGSWVSTNGVFKISIEVYKVSHQGWSFNVSKDNEVIASAERLDTREDAMNKAVAEYERKAAEISEANHARFLAEQQERANAIKARMNSNYDAVVLSLANGGKLANFTSQEVYDYLHIAVDKQEIKQSAELSIVWNGIRTAAKNYPASFPVIEDCRIWCVNNKNEQAHTIIEQLRFFGYTGFYLTDHSTALMESIYYLTAAGAKMSTPTTLAPADEYDRAVYAIYFSID